MSTEAEAAAASVARKRKIRGGHRGSATRTMNAIDALLSEEEPDPARLAQLKLSLQEKLSTLTRLDSEILDLTEDENVDTEIQEADEFKDRVYGAIVRLDNRTRTLTRPVVPPATTAVATSTATPPADAPVVATTAPTTEPPVTTPVSTAPTGGTVMTPATETSTVAPTTTVTTPISTPAVVPTLGVRLPKLTIQPFDGNMTLWTSFWDSFDSAIHQNTGLNEVDKFNYLRSLLRGSARDAISGLMLTEANYAEAISILRRRFGNKQQIITKHMDILMNTEAVTSPHNVQALRHFHDVVESNIRSLKALGVAAETYGSLLASVLMNKLPGDLRLIIGRKIGEADWQLDTIMTELLQEVEARERAHPLSGSAPNNQKRGGGRVPPTAATLLLGDKPHCCYCNRSHTPERCDQVSNPEERKQALMKSGRCFVCLRKGHLGRQCRSKLRCIVCGGRHHSSICAENSPKEKEPSGQVGTPLTGLNPVAPSFQPPATTSMLLVNARGPVLLQTARMKLFNPENPKRSIEVRAILDTGSQQSYTTEKVKDALSLRCHEKRKMSVMTFGASDKRTQTYDIVRIGVTTKDGQKEDMEFVCTPLICQPLTTQPIDICKERYRHLAGLDLADANQGKDDLMEVDLLIGSDYYWWFATGETRRGEDGPVAVCTKLGWVLSGTLLMEEACSTAHNFLTTHVLRIDATPSTQDPLDEVLHSFWNLESLGVDLKADSVLEEFTQTVQFKNGRYEVSLPWKSSHPMLPDNYLLSKKRLDGLVKRLRHDPEVLREYDSIIQSQRSQGIVEEVDPQEESANGQIHYLPHHAVVRRDKSTTKVRVVYDASARSTGCSLNECLHKGPKFDQKILDILIRFRTYKIALTADIEKAFLMVSDNGKTFKTASKTIKAMMQHEEVQHYLSGVGVQWTFNLARAPWWGGVFERMIRMTKRCLKKIVGRARLTLDELTTLITEVGVINSRPISYVSSDDTKEPLTPTHFVAGDFSVFLTRFATLILKKSMVSAGKT